MRYNGNFVKTVVQHLSQYFKARSGFNTIIRLMGLRAFSSPFNGLSKDSS
jgi:hypothetical protein